MRPIMMEIQAAANDARARVTDGDYDAALDALRAVNVTHAAAPVFRYFHASVAMEAERWNEALGILDELLEVEPTRAVIHLDRVMCMMRLGQLSRAAEALAREDTPIRDLFPRWVFLAWVAVRLEKHERAYGYLRHAIVIDKDAVPLAADIAELRPTLQRIMREAMRADAGWPLHGTRKE
jgi:predicted Zn-dependent protease